MKMRPSTPNFFSARCSPTADRALKPLSLRPPTSVTIATLIVALPAALPLPAVRLPSTAAATTRLASAAYRTARFVTCPPCGTLVLPVSPTNDATPKLAGFQGASAAEPASELAVDAQRALEL